MNRKYKILGIIVIAFGVLGYALWPKPVRSSLSGQLPLESLPETREAESSVIAESISTSAIPKDIPVDEKNDSLETETDSFWSRHVILRDKDKGTEETIRIQTLADARERVSSHRNEKPEEEFAALRELNFDNNGDSDFSMSFVSDAGDFEHILLYSPGKNVPNENSCIYLPPLGALKLNSGRFEVRGDGRGYAAVMIDERLYVRSTVAYDEKGPVLYSQLFSKAGLDWKMTKEFLSYQPPRQDLIKYKCRSSL